MVAPLSILSGTTNRKFGLQVLVRDNNVDQALKALKKKMQREELFREIKLRNYYEKPSEKRARQSWHANVPNERACFQPAGAAVRSQPFFRRV